MEQTELLSCPFCGGEATLSVGYLSYAGCKKCEVWTIPCYPAPEAAAAWNRRAAPDEPAPAGDREALGEALIAWAATERTKVHSWGYELLECPFCGAAEDENDYNSQLGYGRIMHAPDCLHLRARKLQEGDDD